MANSTGRPQQLPSAGVEGSEEGKGQGVNRSNLVQISLTTLSGVDKVARCFATSPLSF